MTNLTGSGREPPPATRRRTWVWPVAVLGLLSLNFGIVAWLLHAAHKAGPVDSEPWYYEQAMNWDAVQMQMAVNARLGWTVEWSVGSRGEDLARELTIALRDASGAVVRGAQVEAQMFAHAASTKRQRLVFSGEGPSKAWTSFDRPGLWEVRLTASRGDEVFTWKGDVVVPMDAAAGANSKELRP
jgi:hypothetical protein